MSKVTMTDLHVEDTDFYFDGDLRLLGKTIITNGSLIVTGELILASDDCSTCSFEVINGDVTAKSISTEDCHGFPVNPYETICESFRVKNGDIHIIKGDLDLADCDIDEVCDIYIDEGDLICSNILTSFSIYVNGDISTDEIFSTFDLFCINGDFYGNINCGRDMYVENRCDLNSYGLYVTGSFETTELSNADYVSIGK